MDWKGKDAAARNLGPWGWRGEARMKGEMPRGKDRVGMVVKRRGGVPWVLAWVSGQRWGEVPFLGGRRWKAGVGEV